MDGYRQSPFNEEVRATALPAGFKLSTINMFDGKTDPQDHMDHFNDLMELHRIDDLARCRCFAVTLSGAPKKWFRGLQPGSISSWQQLQTAFLRQFQAAKSFNVPLISLSSIRQGPEETLRSYLNRFTSKLAKVNNPPEGGV